MQTGKAADGKDKSGGHPKPAIDAKKPHDVEHGLVKAATNLEARSDTVMEKLERGESSLDEK